MYFQSDLDFKIVLICSDFDMELVYESLKNSDEWLSYAEEVKSFKSTSVFLTSTLFMRFIHFFVSREQVDGNARREVA